MKKKLCLLAICSALASMAHAQSSVTLYGNIDTSVAYFGHQRGTTSNGSTVEMMSGAMSANLWGLKGSEDLGGGLSAVFQLESGFDVDNGQTGQNGRIFGRTSMVGLSDKTIGTVTLGRQYDPLIDLIQPLTDDGTFGSTFATPGDIDNYDNSYRTNNSIKFASPNYAGLQWSAMYALGGQAGETGSGETYAFAASYAHGPASFAVGYFRATNNSTSGTFDGLNPASVDSQAITGAFMSANSLQMIRAAGDYVFGPITTGLAYSNVQYKDYATAISSATSTFNTAQFFLNYQATPATKVGFGYDYTKGSGNNVDAIYNQFSLGADYALSRRTDLYALAGYQSARGNTVDSSTGTITAATASIGDFGNDASGNTQTMAMVGIRHKF